MCNHYRKGVQVIEWTQVRLGGVKVAAVLGEIFEHTYPKYPAPVVIQQAGERSLVTKSWGIPVPVKGAKDQLITKPVTNARNDKLTGYTWLRDRGAPLPDSCDWLLRARPRPCRREGRNPLHRAARPVFFFAGLWEGDAFTMVTTEPNEFVARFHDRMPVVLDDDDAEEWLGDVPLAADRLKSLCRGLPSDALHYDELPPKLKIVRPSKPTSTDDSPMLF